MPAHLHADAAPGFFSLVLMWQGMMTAMMAPVVWPWLRTYARMGTATPTGHGRLRGTAGFAAGYLASWLGYSVLAAGFQLAATRGWVAVAGVLASGALGGGVLIAAGVYQFMPLKRACLTHCRNPLTYLLTRWREGPAGGFRLGFSHGAYCVGCCWALMLTAFAVGLMNLWWMSALTAVAVVEQAVPHGERLRIPLGAALLAGGLRMVSG